MPLYVKSFFEIPSMKSGSGLINVFLTDRISQFTYSVFLKITGKREVATQTNFIIRPTILKQLRDELGKIGDKKLRVQLTHMIASSNYPVQKFAHIFYFSFRTIFRWPARFKRRKNDCLEVIKEWPVTGRHAIQICR